MTQGSGRPAVPEPESDEFVGFFLGLAPGPYATEVTPTCFQLLAPQALSCTSEPGLGSGWGLGAPGGGAIREAGTTGLDDRHQKPSLNKGWVGGGLVCPHPPSQCLLSQDHSQQGGASMARAAAVLLSLVLQLASQTLAPGTSRGKLGC